MDLMLIIVERYIDNHKQRRLYVGNDAAEKASLRICRRLVKAVNVFLMWISVCVNNEHING